MAQFTIEITESLKEWVEQKAAEWDRTECQVIEALIISAAYAVEDGTLFLKPEESK
jgi:ribosome-associated translation inhibitor RaiA